MAKYKVWIICTLILLIHNVFGLEYNNRQRYTQNSDFLLHESGVSTNTPKRDYVSSQQRHIEQQNTPTNSKTQTRDFVAADFPPLKPPPQQSALPILTNKQQGANNQPNIASTSKPGIRDYVAPNFPPLKSPTDNQNGKQNVPNPSQPNAHSSQTTQTGGKRDYVAPVTPRPHTKNGQLSTSQTSPSLPTPSAPSGKRDYVNPNFPPLNGPASTQQSKVKDLIKFYDGKGKQPATPQRGTFSSVVNNNGAVTKPTEKPAVNQTPKSFSSIVSGSNSHTSTIKPTTGIVSSSHHPAKPTGGTKRPQVLPSSIINSNRHGSNGNSVSDTELQTLSEDLLKKDTNNAAKYITINYQSKTTSQSSEDKAPLPLLTVSPEVWNIPTIQKIVPLLDNYERDTTVNEYVTPQERNEENAFMDAIMSTSVIRQLMTFLKEKGYVTPDPKQQRDFLKQMWFTLYARTRGKLSSSGFEHSFASELHNGGVSGLHNWIYFTKEEQANRLNYLGYLKYVDFNGKGAVVKLHFNQQGVDKPVDSLFIGTSPELEMALYTLCFVTRADNECNIKLAGKDVNIKTYKFRYRSKDYVGSAFPQI